MILVKPHIGMYEHDTYTRGYLLLYIITKDSEIQNNKTREKKGGFTVISNI